MNTREFLNSVIDMANAADTSKTFGSIHATPADLISAAETLTSKLDARNEKRKSADSKQKKEVAARHEVVAKFLNENKGNEFTRDAIAEACGITVGQAQSAALALVRGGIAKKNEVKVDKAKRVVYSITE